MQFIDFLKLLPVQNDDAINSFLTWAKMQKDFPKYSDPHKLAESIYNKLNHKMTTGFQKCLMIYSSTPENEIPKSLITNQQNMLTAINHIVTLKTPIKTTKIIKGRNSLEFPTSYFH